MFDLVRVSPGPPKRVIGSLSDAQTVLRGLDLGGQCSQISPLASNAGTVTQLLVSGQEGDGREEIQLQRKDGSAIAVQASLRGVQAEQLQSICLVVTDLSELKQKEKTIRTQSSQYAALISTTSDGYWQRRSDDSYGHLDQYLEDIA